MPNGGHAQCIANCNAAYYATVNAAYQQWLIDHDDHALALAVVNAERTRQQCIDDCLAQGG